MRKIQVLFVAILAMFAFSAVAVSAASAAEPLWLVSGKSIEGAEEIAADTSGELNLTDLETPGPTEVLCSGLLDGFLLSNGKDLITDVLTLSGELLENDLIECTFTKAGLCQTSMIADVVPIGLPWKTQLELVGGKWFDDTTTEVETGGKLVIGYSVICLTVLGEFTDTCTQELGATEEVNGETGVGGTLSEENTGLCTFSGKNTGDLHGSGITTSESGLVSISEP